MDPPVPTADFGEVDETLFAEGAGFQLGFALFALHLTTILNYNGGGRNQFSSRYFFMLGSSSRCSSGSNVLNRLLSKSDRYMAFERRL